MKKMINTEQLLAEKVMDKSIESYVLLIGYRGDEWTFTSGNVDLDTYFDAASMGKIFPTTTLALKAVDAGKLAFDDRLDMFFSGVPDDKKNITVKHLMTHTSGMIRKEFSENVAERGRESIADFILNVPLAYETGTKYAYCCTGMVLLGFIVEKVFDMPLDEAFQKLLCKPLGLTRSRYNILPEEHNAVNCNHFLAVNDIRWDDHNVSMMKGIPSGAGGNFCTAGDLQKFVKAIIRRDDRLYGKNTFDLAEQNCTAGLEALDEFRGTEDHALGGYIYVNERCAQARDLFPNGSIGHTGWTGQSFYLNREQDLYVILLTDATRCTAKKYGTENYNDVRELRTEIHRAIKKDLR